MRLHEGQIWYLSLSQVSQRVFNWFEECAKRELKLGNTAKHVAPTVPGTLNEGQIWYLSPSQVNLRGFNQLEQDLYINMTVVY